MAASPGHHWVSLTRAQGRVAVSVLVSQTPQGCQRPPPCSDALSAPTSLHLVSASSLGKAYPLLYVRSAQSRSWRGYRALTRARPGSPPAFTAGEAEAGAGWKRQAAPTCPLDPGLGGQAEGRRVFCRVQIPTWLPGFPALLLAAGPPSRLLPSPPCHGSLSTPNCRQPECRRSGAWAARGPYFLKGQFLTSGGNEYSGNQGWGWWQQPPGRRGGLCTWLLTTTSQAGLEGEDWTIRHTPQGASDQGSKGAHIRRENTNTS